MQTRPCDVSPTGDQDKYTLALQEESGKWMGFDVLLSQIFPKSLTTDQPIQRVGFNSYHAGRGVDRFTSEQYAFWDGRNGWSTTPGKYHATQLFRWARGLRSTDHNMPNANGVTFVGLFGKNKFLDVSFTASASYTAAKLTLILRRRVPAGTVGAPGTLSIGLFSNSSGYPGTLVTGTSATLTSATLTDVTSEYYVFTISAALSASTIYHLKVYGADNDKSGACWEIGCDPAAAGLRNRTDSNWSTASEVTTYSPYFRITDADSARSFKPFIFDGALYLVGIYDDLSTTSKLYINGVRGRAVGTQSTTALVDTGHGSYDSVAWPTNRFTGAFVRFIRGTGQGQVRQIASNTGDTIVPTVAFDIAPVAGDTEYIVYSSEWFVELGSTGLGVVTGEPAIQNGIVYFPQGDSTNIRIMRMDYSDADDHAFDVENTNNNKAYFLSSGYDTSLGPLLWRANQADTTGTPAAKKISVAPAPTSPAGTPVPFGTDVTFGASILAGDNTNRITGIITHENILHVRKEDGLFVVQNNQAARIKIGVEDGPSVNNGKAACVGADKQLYIGYQNDVYLITGGGAYPTKLKDTLPANRSGYPVDLEPMAGWIFAAVDAGSAGYSSVMKFSLDTNTWSEQLRGYFLGRRIRAVQKQDCPETRDRLWIDIGGEMIFQEFPINGVRPIDDPGEKYQHEYEIITPTIDLFNTDPKYYALFTVNSKGLSTTSDPDNGNEIVIEYQTDNDVNTGNWQHAGYIRKSPSASVEINQGEKRMMRVRARGISNDALTPIELETMTLSLFSRGRVAHQWTIYFRISDDDDEQNSHETLQWLIEQYKAKKLKMLSIFDLYHNRNVTLVDEPIYKVEEIDPDEDQIEATISMTLMEIL